MKGTGGNISDPQTLNKYFYVRNNLVNLVDPTGLTETGLCGSEEGLESCGDTNCVIDGSCVWFPPGDPGEGDTGPVPVDHPPSPGPDIYPSSGESSSRDPWIFGCESGGIHCGMQFPIPGGGLSGGTYSSGSCGEMANGYGEEAIPNYSWRGFRWDWMCEAAAIGVGVLGTAALAYEYLLRLWEMSD